MEGHGKVAWLLDIPGLQGSMTILIQHELVKNYEEIIHLHEDKTKNYDSWIYSQDQRILLLQGMVDALLLARETSFGKGAA